MLVSNKQNISYLDGVNKNVYVKYYDVYVGVSHSFINYWYLQHTGRPNKNRSVACCYSKTSA